VIGGTPRPLPDCALCGTPTRRRTHRQNGGMCTDCRRVYDAKPRAEQQALPLITDTPPPPAPDLTNVVVLDTRRRGRPGGRR
jgi:hypothetical protein